MVIFWVQTPHAGLTTSSMFSFPIRICWEITSRCNYSCIHCYHNKNSSSPLTKNDLTYNEAAKFLGYLKGKAFEISIGGGEPLLFPNIARLLNGYVDFFQFTVSTNASLITQPFLERFSKKISFQISIDGLEATHNLIRNKKNAFKKSINSIELLLDNGYKASVGITISKLNINEIGTLIKLLKREGISFFHFNTYIGSHPVLMLDKRCMVEANKILDMLSGDSSVKVSIRDPLFDLCPGSCQACITTVNICPNGDVTPCCYLDDLLGNIRKRSLQRVWLSDKAKHYRHPLSFACEKCDSFDKCRGGCWARKKVISGRDNLCFQKT